MEKQVKRTKQVNFRVTEDHWNVLRALANIHGGTVPSIAYAIVEQAVEKARKDPHVKADLRNRADFQEETAARILRFDARRSRRK